MMLSDSNIVEAIKKNYEKEATTSLQIFTVGLPIFAHSYSKQNM